MSINVNRENSLSVDKSNKTQPKKEVLKAEVTSPSPSKIFNGDATTVKKPVVQNSENAFTNKNTKITAQNTALKVNRSIDFNNKNLPAPVIKKLQEFFQVNATGVFNEETALKTFEFQKNNGLVADGKIGKNTISKLIKSGLEAEEGTYPKYDKLFEDGVLDVTVGVGYDETGWGDIAYNELKTKLNDRGYKQLSDAERPAVLKSLNIEDTKNESVSFYYKQSITTHNNKPVAGVIKVIKSNETDGSKAKEAFIEGLNKSDITAYAGHGRYGTGMDFDRNFTIKTNINGKQAEFKDYEAFEKELDKPELKEILEKAPNAKSMSNQAKVDYLISQKVLEIQTFNKGNIVVNEKSPHSWEFGGHLIEKSINSKDDKPTTLLESVSKTEKYKIWNIVGCRTDDYLAKIKTGAKTNVNLQGKNLDIFTTKRVAYWNNTISNALAVVDGVSNNESAQQIKKRLENVDLSTQKDIITTTGFTDNPRIAVNKGK